jgi:hypothetical protein
MFIRQAWKLQARSVCYCVVTPELVASLGKKLFGYVVYRNMQVTHNSTPGKQHRNILSSTPCP